MWIVGAFATVGITLAVSSPAAIEKDRVEKA